MTSLIAGRAAIRVGTFQSVSATVLAMAISAGNRRDPDLQIELVDAPRPLDQLHAGEVDLAFSETRPTDTSVEYTELLEDP